MLGVDELDIVFRARVCNLRVDLNANSFVAAFFSAKNWYLQHLHLQWVELSRV